MNSLEALADPESKAASDTLRRVVFHRNLQLLESYLESEATLEQPGVAAAASGDTGAYLTSDELAELSRDLDALVERWEARSDPNRPGAHPVVLIYHAFRRPM